MSVFISHCFDDREQIANVRHCLEQQGILCWHHSQIKAGEPLRDRIRDAIQGCSCCVFIATSNSLSSDWCHAEIGAFWGARKPVIVYLAENQVSNDELPKHLQGDKWANTLPEVVGAVKEYLKKSPQIQPPIWVEKIFDLAPIMSDLKNAEHVKIFLGVKNDNLVHSIVSTLKAIQASYRFYVDARMLVDLMSVDPGLSLSHVQVSPCPLDSCAIFSYSPRDHLNWCRIIRFVPKREFFWSSLVRENEEFLFFIEQTYRNFYEEDLIHKRVLKTPFDALFFSKVAQERVKNDRELQTGNYAFTSRCLQYNYASFFIKKANRSIKAIDNTEPKWWFSESYLDEYMEENRKSSATEKIRINVFNKKEIMKNVSEYKRYIVEMENAGFELYFVDERHMPLVGLSPQQGVVIIDGQIVFITNDDRSPVENGTVILDCVKIKDQEKKFDALMRRAVDHNEFLKKLYAV